MRVLRKRLESGDLPDLILLDLKMPLMDGHEVLEELQRDSVLWQIPCVVFSSSSRGVDMRLSFLRGAIAFETKPSRFSEVVNFVSSFTRHGSHPPYDYFEDVKLDDWA